MAVINYLTQPLRQVTWLGVDQWVKYTFPTVPAIAPQILDQWLQQPSTPPPILLDVRTAEEFAVSHLPEAHHTPTLESVLALNLDPQQPMVAYCSVGYRSARLVAQLQQRGFTEAYNLTGSLFQWANGDRPVKTPGHSAPVIHPYNRLWGLLLKPTLAKAYDPPHMIH
jgi:rhodanese-related sulfurtransferase